MDTLRPLNDLAKIQLDEAPLFGDDDRDGAESGILVELPEAFTYFGFWSFAFEKSFMAKEELAALHEFWKPMIGKRVYWTALSEKGNIIEKEGRRYAFVKFTSLIASDSSDSIARNVHSDGGGAFKA